MMRCEHWSEEQGRTYGWHHQVGPHACDPAAHDGECPWWTAALEAARTRLPEPACELGYSEPQLREALGEELNAALREYLRGQTVGLRTGEYTACAEPHGEVVYPRDIERFLAFSRRFSR